MRCLILAGGFGTRLRQRVRTAPKPMAPINDIPFLELLVKHVHYHGVEEIIFATGYKGIQIKDYFKNEFDTISIKYSQENEPLGTGGAVKLAINSFGIAEPLIVLNGDTFFDVNLKFLYAEQISKNPSSTLALFRADKDDRYGRVSIDNRGKITEMGLNLAKTGEVAIGGCSVLDPLSYMSITNGLERFSFEEGYLIKAIETADGVRGLVFDTYFIDIGTPEDYDQAQQSSVLQKIKKPENRHRSEN